MSDAESTALTASDEAIPSAPVASAEPAEAPASDEVSAEPRCLNCEAPAPDDFCPQCGQATRELRGPFREMMHEFFDHLSLDSKLPRSLFALIFQPGRLTEHYLAGRRARYLPPLRTYLFVSLVFFMLFSIASPDISNFNIFIGDEQVQSAESTNRITLTNSEPETWLGRQIHEMLAEQFARFREMDPQLLVDRLAGGIQSNFPRALFLFLPLVALVLKLLFLRSGRLYFDHLIFALHCQSFFFLVLSLTWIFGNVWLYLVAAFLCTPVYLLVALRRVYRQRWWWLLPKWILLLGSYLFLMIWVIAAVLIYVLRTI